MTLQDFVDRNNRGVTFRQTANGKRMMVHRWHYRKIRGAIRYQDAERMLFDEIYQRARLRWIEAFKKRLFT